jgi:hypothetical protein
VVQISDGAVQTSGVAVKVIPQGGSEASGAGTVAYSADGVVLYTPTQGETDYTAFALVASKAGCIPATVTVVTSASDTAGYAGIDWAKIGNPTTAVALSGTTISPVTVGANNDKAGYSLTPTTGLGNQTANITGNLSGSVGSVTGAVGSVTARVTANVDEWGGAPVTGMPLPAISYTAPDNASVTAIKAVTDKLNTTLAADGLLWQFTVNALENAPGGGGGGSATLENQELILANLDNVTGAVAAAVARLQLETQITGFPATICRGSDYDEFLDSEIRLQLLDLNNDPITEIGGVPVDEITWLFGFGTDRQPRLVEGACSWDDVTSELVIEIVAADTMDTPLGAVTWQIGAQIGDLVRWLGGGTTRIIERQFAA